VFSFYIINQSNHSIDSYTSAQPTNLSPGTVYPSTVYHRPILGVDCTGENCDNDCYGYGCGYRHSGYQ
jgi:hypothetical protein